MPWARHMLDRHRYWIGEENLSSLWDTKVNHKNIFKNSVKCILNTCMKRTMKYNFFQLFFSFSLTLKFTN